MIKQHTHEKKKKKTRGGGEARKITPTWVCGVECAGAGSAVVTANTARSCSSTSGLITVGAKDETENRSRQR